MTEPRTTLIDACLTCGVNPRDVRRPDSSFHGMSIPGVMAAVCSECQAKVEPPRPRVLPTATELEERGVKPNPRQIVQHFPADWPTDEQYQRWLRGLDAPAPTLQSAGLMPTDGQGWDDSSTDGQWDGAHAAAEDLDFLSSGGWHIANADSPHRGGLRAHRGVLFPGEFVDRLSLRDAVLERLGYTLEQINSVYKQGRKSDDQRQLRGKIDASLLALSRDGATVSKLSEALLLDDNVVTSALSRARAARLA